jgi:hypothetical protein
MLLPRSAANEGCGRGRGAVEIGSPGTAKDGPNGKSTDGRGATVVALAFAAPRAAVRSVEDRNVWKATRRRSRFGMANALASGTLLIVVTSGIAASNGTGKSAERSLHDAAEGTFEVLEAANQYAEARTAPGEVVAPGAFSAAYLQAKNLPTFGGSWTEATTKNYDSDAHGYRDPVWSNSGGGAGLVSGRVTALAVDGSTLYAGTADGGVWKRAGGTWSPLLDDSPTLSIGAVAVDANHGLWVGTGEANTNGDSYAGIGILFSADGGATFDRVGGEELQNSLVARIVMDGGYVLAATSTGLYRHPVGTTAGAWNAALKPGPCTASGGAPGVVYVSDVAVKPGTGGQVVDAVIGWRAGSNCNGLFESTDGGSSFHGVTVGGALNQKDLGRTSIAWSADGSRVYAVVQSASMFNHARTDHGGTILQGVYASSTGFAGPWNKVAEWRNLANGGSALKAGLGYHPGVQAWYNEFLAVDPQDANHVYLGLEEVFESTDGGGKWTAVGPYWNFGMPCSAGPQGLDGCPMTTHPDQHAIAIHGDTVYVGNDGGVYSRARSDHAQYGWSNLNAGLRTLQYYYADAGPIGGGDALWGGLQDNGESLLTPGAPRMVSPFGGDGGDTLVDHTNGDRAVVEYTDLDMALTTNGGRSDGSPGSNAFREISPSCFAFTYTPKPCDPLARFTAPFEADLSNPNLWIAGGEYVWTNDPGGVAKGWDTTCGPSACDWTIRGDSGAGHSITQVTMSKGTWYAAWCGPCNADGFARGILTNAGGTVHQLAMPASFPNRFIQGLVVDKDHPEHAYVVFSGFSRLWTSTFSAGEGHVLQTTDSGASWTDISGNLPDAPGNDLVMTANGGLVVGTDIGVFYSPTNGGTWYRFGIGLPNASTNDLQLSPDGSYILAATHGRGLWTISTP